MSLSPASLLVLVPGLPLLGAVLTIALGRRLGPRAHLPAVVSILAAAACSLALLAITFRDVHGPDGLHGSTTRPVEMVTTLWRWATVDDALPPTPGSDLRSTQPFAIDVSLRVDPLTSTLLAVVTCVGLLVAVFSIGYMHDDPGYARFFALVAAFVFSMSMLVAASNFLVVYVFWEAVGACSYLLIGFWFRKPAAAAAAKKAFLVNRVGDFGLAVAVFLLWLTYGTLDFHDTLSPAGTILPGILGQTRLADVGGFVGGPVGMAICLLLLLAACGKSAQLPLHVWLPDAMEGPTPASALIHAATMVTAGVYLVARSAPLFAACPAALVAVSTVGAVTALMAALTATVQNDLKRVLAYSTISQLGYMFVSLGTGSLLGFTAGIFHLVTHALFKALLFMGAGSVMHAMGGVIDMRRFGGLRRVMPVTAATFLVGSLALAGVPPFAGFFSKDEILASVHARAWPGTHHDQGHESGLAGTDPSLRMVSLADDHAAVDEPDRSLDTPATWQGIWWMSLITAGLTAFYTFRAFFMSFTGPTRVPDEAGHDHSDHSHHSDHRHEIHPNDAAKNSTRTHAASHESPPVMTVPLVILAVASLVSGWLIFATHALSGFLPATPSLAAAAIAATATQPAFHVDIAIQGTLAAVLGIVIAAVGHLGRRSDSPQVERWLGPLGWLFANRFFFDQIYAALIVRPLEGLATLAAAFDRRVIDGTVDAVARLPAAVAEIVRQMQSGLVQRYALAGVVATLLIVASLVWTLSQ